MNLEAYTFLREYPVSVTRSLCWNKEWTASFMTPSCYGGPGHITVTSYVSPDDALLKLKRLVLSEQWKGLVEEWFTKQADWEPYRQKRIGQEDAWAG